MKRSLIKWTKYYSRNYSIDALDFEIWIRTYKIALTPVADVIPVENVIKKRFFIFFYDFCLVSLCWWHKILIRKTWVSYFKNEKIFFRRFHHSTSVFYLRTCFQTNKMIMIHVVNVQYRYEFLYLFGFDAVILFAIGFKP